MHSWQGCLPPAIPPSSDQWASQPECAPTEPDVWNDIQICGTELCTHDFGSQGDILSPNHNGAGKAGCGGNENRISEQSPMGVHSAGVLHNGHPAQLIYPWFCAKAAQRYPPGWGHRGAAWGGRPVAEKWDSGRAPLREANTGVFGLGQEQGLEPEKFASVTCLLACCCCLLVLNMGRGV